MTAVVLPGWSSSLHCTACIVHNMHATSIRHYLSAGTDVQSPKRLEAGGVACWMTLSLPQQCPRVIRALLAPCSMRCSASMWITTNWFYINVTHHHVNIVPKSLACSACRGAPYGTPLCAVSLFVNLANLSSLVQECVLQICWRPLKPSDKCVTCACCAQCQLDLFCILNDDMKIGGAKPLHTAD